MEACVAEAVEVDPRTALIRLTAPNPRFLFQYFTHHFCSGVPIVPRHVWEGATRRPSATSTSRPAGRW